ncbi:insulinase family protein [Candidatus Parcubacteria bacterium]|nr:insulinase family protein [Candidatus Parcubacteria bacterium]
MKYKKTKLPNGLRIITIPTKSPATTVLIMVETGSNYESKEHNGLSHFLEHMCFKGTKNRPSAVEIALEFDTMGSSHNAFTSNEFTGYYAKAERKQWKNILNILSDMYLHPTLPETDLERERGVILQEISMYEDQPQAIVWHTLFELLYGDTPAGRQVAGTPENVKRFTREDFVSYRSAHYVASKTVVVVAGDVRESDVKGEVMKYFKEIPRAKKLAKEAVEVHQKEPGLLIHDKDTDQVHMVLALHAYKATDKRVPALSLLSAVLGNGMSSRLFHKLRHEMGACYYINTHNEEYTDHGLLTISTGVDAKRVREVVRVILEECARLLKAPIPKEELDKAKEYLIGHLYLGLETSDSLAEFYAGQEVTKGRSETPEEIERALRRVTPKDVQKIAGDIFRNEKLNLALVGKVEDKEELRKVLTF